MFVLMQADNSTRDSGVSSECVMDYTSEFTTYAVNNVSLNSFGPNKSLVNFGYLNASVFCCIDIQD